MKPKLKICPSCEVDLGMKVRTCPSCGHKFTFKKGKYELIREPLKLKEKDTFILKSGSGGPYYITETGSKIPMSYRGNFVVLSVEKDGIVAYSPNYGCCFIYLGVKKVCTETNIYRRPYKLFKKI